MTITKNKIQIEKCIISFSHNKYDSRRLADKFSIAKAKGEIAAGKNGISHLILRSRDDEIDRLKFLFLIHGIPLMCYSLGNLICSSLKEIVVVGSDEVQRVLERFLNTGGIPHGGFIATIADTGMGNAAHLAAGNKRCVTINLDIKFISAGKLNEKLIGKVKVLKKTKTLVFISCEIFGTEKIVATASGIWKIL